MKGNFEVMICGTKFRCEISFLCVLPREVSDIYLLGIVTSSKYGHQRQVRKKYLQTWTSTSRVCRRLEWTIQEIHLAQCQAQNGGSVDAGCPPVLSQWRGDGGWESGGRSQFC